MLHQTHNSQGNFNYNAFIYDSIVWESHFHGNFELIYTLEGQTEVAVNERRTVLQKEELILIPPYTVHALTTRTGNKTWVGVFSEDYVEYFKAKNGQNRYLQFTCEKYVEEFLKTALFFEGEPERYALIACLNLVCSQCVQRADLDAEHIKSSFVEEVVSYVSEHLEHDITLKGLARELGYEYHYFSALFHRNFAMHFKNFIHLFRHEKACRMLQEEKEDITRIAGLCGFGSVRNFNRVFKALSGMTPLEYRREIKK